MILPDEIRDLLDELAEASRLTSRAGSSVALPAAEARVLRGLMYSHRTQADLSRRLAMDTALVSRTVQRLKQKGLVEPSQIAAASKGSQLLWLTSSGREKAHAAQQEEVRVVQEYLRDEQARLRLMQCCHAIGNGLGTEPTRPLVEQAELSDLGVFLRMAAITLVLGPFGPFDERVEAELAKIYVQYAASKERSLFLVALYRGDSRGGLIAIPRSATEARLAALVVDRDYLRCSIGRALVEDAKKRLRTLGYRAISTQAPRGPRQMSFFEHGRWRRGATIRREDLGPPMDFDEWHLEI